MQRLKGKLESWKKLDETSNTSIEVEIKKNEDFLNIERISKDNSKNEEDFIKKGDFFRKNIQNNEIIENVKKRENFIKNEDFISEELALKQIENEKNIKNAKNEEIYRKTTDLLKKNDEVLKKTHQDNEFLNKNITENQTIITKDAVMKLIENNEFLDKNSKKQEIPLKLINDDEILINGLKNKEELLFNKNTKNQEISEIYNKNSEIISNIPRHCKSNAEILRNPSKIEDFNEFARCSTNYIEDELLRKFANNGKIVKNSKKTKNIIKNEVKKEDYPEEIIRFLVTPEKKPERLQETPKKTVKIHDHLKRTENLSTSRSNRYNDDNRSERNLLNFTDFQRKPNFLEKNKNFFENKGNFIKKENLTKNADLSKILNFNKNGKLEKNPKINEKSEKCCKNKIKNKPILSADKLIGKENTNQLKISQWEWQTDQREKICKVLKEIDKKFNFLKSQNNF